MTCVGSLPSPGGGSLKHINYSATEASTLGLKELRRDVFASQALCGLIQAHPGAKADEIVENAWRLAQLMVEYQGTK